MSSPAKPLALAGAGPRWRSRWLALGAIAVPVLAVIVLGALTLSSSPTLTVDATALARVGLPFGGGSVSRLSVVGGREQKIVPVALRGDRIWPTGRLRAGETVTVDVTVKRPGWISWLAGARQEIHLTFRTPVAKLRSAYVTVKPGQPVLVSFREPVRVVEDGQIGSPLVRHVLPSAVSAYSFSESGSAGAMSVAAAPRTWETPRATVVSWFPAGAAATAVAVPQPGTTIGPDQAITMTFSKPVATVLGSTEPPVSPDTPGVWHTLNSHTIRFEPEGYGYGLGASVSVGLPAGVNLVGGQAHGSDPIGKWSVPAGSTTRLQQLLAMLGYLPLSFKYAGGGVAPTVSAEVAAAIKPPAGRFDWRYPNTPSALHSLWQAGAYGELTTGAVMAFENTEGMTADGLAGPAVWKALINAVLKGQRNTFGYTFVQVSEGSPEGESTWHNGKSVVSGPVNTGIPQAPTAEGVFAVYEHLTVTTMSGLNPDGTPYSDPGIPWVSYFNGGDALHGFIRASYGFPQSLGCVEMPYSEAGQVWPYTPIGTIVDVS